MLYFLKNILILTQFIIANKIYLKKYIDYHLIFYLLNILDKINKFTFTSTPVLNNTSYFQYINYTLKKKNVSTQKRKKVEQGSIEEGIGARYPAHSLPV